MRINICRKYGWNWIPYFDRYGLGQWTFGWFRLMLRNWSGQPPA
jgi:hypothetical protein